MKSIIDKQKNYKFFFKNIHCITILITVEAQWFTKYINLDDTLIINSNLSISQNTINLRNKFINNSFVIHDPLHPLYAYILLYTVSIVQNYFKFI